MIEVFEAFIDRDREWKREIYARAGLPVYWLVDVTAGAVEVYEQPVAGSYRVKRVVKLDGTLELAEPALQLRVADIWAQ